jgi:hypothetical protein
VDHTTARFEHGLPGGIIESWRAIFARQRAFAEHAFDQLDDAGFFWIPGPGLNSVAVIARHLAGNMQSRWTDFLTSDGEKAWRDRDAEFFPPAPSAESRSSIMAAWSEGWALLDAALAGLSPADLSREITIRGAPHAVHAAVTRQLDHYAFHVGQINVIARLRVGSANWRWFTLPPGGTASFNADMRARRGGA